MSKRNVKSSGRDRLTTSTEPEAKSAVGAAKGWHSLSPGWPLVPLESAGITRTGSIPLHRCPCHHGNCCQRHRAPRVALPSPWQYPSPSARPPAPAVGRRSLSPHSPTGAALDEELQRLVCGAEGLVPAHHHLLLEEPHHRHCPPMLLCPTGSARLSLALFGSAQLHWYRLHSAKLSLACLPPLGWLSSIRLGSASACLAYQPQTPPRNLPKMFFLLWRKLSSPGSTQDPSQASARVF